MLVCRAMKDLKNVCTCCAECLEKKCVKNCSQQNYSMRMCRVMKDLKNVLMYCTVGHTWVEGAVQSVCKNVLKYICADVWAGP